MIPSLYVQSQIYPPQYEGNDFWFLDTIITYKKNQDVPLFPTRNCPHETFFKFSQTGELLDIHYFYQNRMENAGTQYEVIYKEALQESLFHIDKNENIYLLVRSLYGDSPTLDFS